MTEDAPKPHLSESVREITVKTAELNEDLKKLASEEPGHHQIWLLAISRDFREVSRRLNEISEHIELERHFGGQNG